MRQPLPLLALTGALLAAGACGRLGDDPEWWDALDADSPCYRVDVLDGLDESSTAEVDDLFACVNLHGHIEPLVPAVEGLHWDARSGDPAAIELARTVNAMTRADLDPFAIAGLLTEALRAEDRSFDSLVDLFLELSYGERSNRVRTGVVALTSREDLEEGVLVPLAPVIPIAAGALLDDPTDTASWVGTWLASSETKRWIRTLEGWTASADPVVQRPVDELVLHLGEVLQASRDRSNDEWSLASGNSLRDLLEVYYLRDEAPVLVAIADEATILLTDEALRAALPDALVDLHTDGHLQEVGSDVVWMTTVDAQGDPRGPGEDSALEAFVRMLARANGPVDCLGLYQTENLAVDVLGVLADLDPDTALVGLEVVAWITGNSVTDWALEGAVDLGVCDGIDQALLDDVDAVAVIVEPEAYDLLVSFVRVLRVLKDESETNRLYDLADLVQDLYDNGGYEPLEEVVRDVGELQLLVDLVDLVPVLADPGAHGITAGAEPAVGLQDALGLLEWVFSTDPAIGLTGWERLRPLVRPVLAHDGTWTALEHASGLMVDDRTQTSQVLTLLPPLLELDPDLTLLDQVALLLGDEALQGPVLRLVETPPVTGALLASEPAAGQDEVPLAFAARLMIGGTLDDLLALVDMLFGEGGGRR